VRALGFTVYDSGANFFFMRCGTPERARAIFDGLRRKDVLVRYFRSRNIDDCLRVSVGTDADMDGFVERLRGTMKEI
jgi:histidinol-phosphate aminotransferase